MFKRKSLVYSLLALLVLILIVVSVYSGRGVVAVTVLAERSSLEVSIREEGQTRMRDSFVLTTPVAGQLERVQWREGDRVERGTTLFRVLPLPESEQAARVTEAQYDAALARKRQADALVEDARAVADQASVSLRRQRALAEEDVISAESLEQSVLQARSADRQFTAAVETMLAAGADVALAEAMLISDEEDREQSGYEMKAPLEGRILRVFEKSERVLQTGSPVLEMGDMKQMELVVDVLSEDAVRVRSGNMVHITQWGGAGVLEGIVQFVEPAAFTKLSALGVEEQRVNIIVTMDDIPDALGVGFRIEANIVVWSEADVVVVPISSVFREGDEWYTFVVSEDVVSKRALRVGERSAELMQVLSGLDEGEEVVRFPSVDIDEGTLIKR